MITVRHRAPNDLDLTSLTEGRGSLARNLLTVTLPAAGLVFVVVYLIWRSFLAAGAASAGLVIASAFSNISFFREVRRRRGLLGDEGAVEVFDVVANRLLDIEPLGDNAPALCFFVGPRQALLLVGQWLLQYDSFPAESFRLHRWAHNKKCIRIEVTGPPIMAEHSKVQLRPTYRFRKLEFIDASPETLQQDLDRALDKNLSRRKPAL